MDPVSELRTAYGRRKPEIARRLAEFCRVWKTGDSNRIFEELCFCILTANTSAAMGIDCIAKARRHLFTCNAPLLSRKLKGIYRFYNVRARYICETRAFLEERYAFDLVGLIGSFNDPMERRAYFAETREIRGIGYKEASHFLRNIGFRGYAILDKHILRSLHELGIIPAVPASLTPRRYVEIEGALAAFSQKVGIGMDELDLLLWSEKTGCILK